MSLQSSELLTEKSTFVTPTLSEAFAVMMTVLPRFTVPPLRRLVIETIGGVVSTIVVGMEIEVGGTGVGVGVPVGIEESCVVGVGVGGGGNPACNHGLLEYQFFTLAM